VDVDNNSLFAQLLSMGQILVVQRKDAQAEKARTMRNAVPKSYRAKFIEPGIISYEDSNDGVVFVSKDALDRMAPTFKGCPVIFVPELHNDSEPETAFNFGNAVDQAQGIVSSDPEWEDDGWQHVNLLVWDPGAQKAIENGYSVSCAYRPTEEGPGGEYHNISYDAEMKNGEYMHMAIVPKPRYEGSAIRANAKGVKNMKLKLFRKNAEPVAPKPAEKEKMVPLEGDPQVVNADDTMVQLPDGSQASLSELIAAYKESGAEEPLDMDDMVDVDGRQVAVSELVAAYQSKSGGTSAPSAGDDQMENADPPTDTPAQDVVDTDAQGPGVRSNGKRMVNSAVRSAAQKTSEDIGIERPETRHDRLERGNARYSRKVAQGGTK